MKEDINKSVCNLLVERDKYKKLYEESCECANIILGKIYSIGSPLNDNILKYNNKQLKIFSDIADECKYIIDIGEQGEVCKRI